MEFAFCSRAPGAGLARYVESIWYARGRISYRRERIAPTGSTVAGIVLGSPIRQVARDGRGETLLADAGFLIGPHDRPIVNWTTSTSTGRSTGSSWRPASAGSTRLTSSGTSSGTPG